MFKARSTKVPLVPFQAISSIDKQGQCSWIADSSFPLFVLGWEGQHVFNAGYMLIKLNLKPKNNCFSPRLCFDRGLGFSEDDCINLPITKKGNINHIFLVPDDAKALGLSPVDKLGTFELSCECIILKQVNAIECYFRRLHRIVKFYQNPKWHEYNNGNYKKLSFFSLFIRQKILYRDISYFRSYKSPPPTTYARWIAANEKPKKERRRKCDSEIFTFNQCPVFSIILPVFNPPLEYLEKALDSVINQVYPYWELCIADDASSDRDVHKLIRSYSRRDKRIRSVFRAENGHISQASNSALSIANGEFVVFLDQDDELSAFALYEFAQIVNKQPRVKFIYSDEDKIDANNERFDPHFKSDWNPELFYSINYICHLSAIDRQLVERVGGFRVGFEGSQDYDLFLRCVATLQTEEIFHVPQILYHWRAIVGSTALSIGEKDYATPAGVKALQEFTSSVGWNCTVRRGPQPTTYRLVPQESEEPKISILIPTRNGYEILSKCIKSIVDRTRYNNYEIIIIDNNSNDRKTIDYLAKLQDTHENINIVPYKKEFNFSKLNNYAAEYAHGELICLLNNDTEVISPDWLHEMKFYATQKNIGCVGAKLLYPDGTLQHGGVILGIGGVAGHSHKYLESGSLGYFCRAALPQALSAVTAACLMVRKDIFFQVGGFDERLAVAFNDVDLCLKIREAGYRNVWTPYALLYHYESKSRGSEDRPEKLKRFQREIRFMDEKWGTQLENDPYYNPSLTLEKEDFSIAGSFCPQGRLGG